MLRKDQILFFVCLGYVGGVFLGSFFIIPSWFFCLSGACVVTICVVSFRMSTLVLCGIFASFLFGYVGVIDARHNIERLPTGEYVSGSVRVLEEREEKVFYRNTVVRMETCDTRWCPKEKILWRAPLVSDTAAGTRMRFSCTLVLPEHTDTTFDYRMFLAKDGIGYVCTGTADSEMLSPDWRSRLTSSFFRPKHVFEQALEKSLPQPEAGLAQGLLLGGSERLPENLRDAFSRAGVSHIVAISGYNIALIANGLVILGIGAGLWRKQALWCAAAGVVMFVFLVGAPASAIRAGVMALCAFLALFFGRLSHSANILLFAAALMLALQPLLLRYDVGFQLSFLAALGIITASPFLERWLARDFFGKSFVEVAILTFSVELFVIPLLAFQFQTFSPLALVANILLLPLVPYAMTFSFVAGLSFLLLPGAHLIPAGIAYGFLRTMTFSVEYANTVPGVSMETSFNAETLLLWYGSLFLVIVWVKRYVRKRYVQKKFPA